MERFARVTFLASYAWTTYTLTGVGIAGIVDRTNCIAFARLTALQTINNHNHIVKMYMDCASPVSFYRLPSANVVRKYSLSIPEHITTAIVYSVNS